MRLIYLDDGISAWKKPPGLMVHRSRLARDEVTCLSEARRRLGRLVYPVHRLDRPTSGLLLFALSPEAAREVAARFREGAVRKTYYAIARGWTGDSGVIDRAAGEEGARKSAVTRFATIARAELPVPCGRYASTRWSLVRADPGSGRYHQIRQHFRSISHPLIGDTRYGDGRQNRVARERLGAHRLFLFAKALELPHPSDGRPLRIELDWEEDWKKAFAELGWEAPPAGSASGPA